MTKRPVYLFMVVLLYMCSMSVQAGQQPRFFIPGSYSHILEQYHHRPFVLVLWSLDCTSCYRELQMLGKYASKFNGVNIVLVSTDSDVPAEEINTVLQRYQLHNMDSWIFADENVQRLRYEIDQQWYGELPRSYLFDASHQRVSVSGVLSDALLEKWYTKL